MQSYSPVLLSIDLKKLTYNIQHTHELCKANSLSLSVVTKSVCCDREILRIVEESAVDTIADSRVDNFARMETKKTKFLIRPSVPQEADAVVNFTDLSMQSSLESVMALGAAAKAAGKTHRILIMIDPGDLRDGIYIDHREEILSMAEYIHAHANLSLSGIAANYNCFLGLQPLPENMKALADLFEELQPYYDVDEPILSGGNSSSVRLLTEHTYPIPDCFNQFRMGEAIMLGRDPSDNTFIPDYETEVFTLSVPLIEVQEKPVETEAGRVQMRRGILSLGQQDLQTHHLIPRNPCIRVLGSCSDETVLDLSACEGLRAGDVLDFDLEYGALMTLFSGHFFQKRYL